MFRVNTERILAYVPLPANPTLCQCSVLSMPSGEWQLLYVHGEHNQQVCAKYQLVLRRHMDTNSEYVHPPLQKNICLCAVSYSCGSSLCVLACVPPSLEYQCGFSPPLQTPSHLRLALLCQPVSLCHLFFCFFKRLCAFPTGLWWNWSAWRHGNADYSWNQQARRTDDRSAPREEGCARVCECWLIFYERAERGRET